jgi:hypothetical protein
MARKYKAKLDTPLGTTGWVEFFVHEFRWPVYADGYRWIETRKAEWSKSYRPVPMLVQQAGEASQRQRNLYAPLRERPALFRTFADTPATPDGILAFARRFGMLGGAAAVDTDIRLHPTDPDSGECLQGEPLDEWLDRIFAMRQVVALWEMASARDVGGLRDVIVRGFNVIQFQPKAAWLLPTWRLAEAAGEATEEPPLFQDESIPSTEPFILTADARAVERFQRFSDEGVIAWAFIAVEGIANRFLRGAVQCNLRVDSELGVAEVVQEPDNLGSALWLQFAKAADAGTRFRICKTCGEWFDLPLRGARLTREYCSDACRIRAYRNRQERARELAAGGMEPRDIARELNATVVVVRKWLKTGKGT